METVAVSQKEVPWLCFPHSFPFVNMERQLTSCHIIPWTFNGYFFYVDIQRLSLNAVDRVRDLSHIKVFHRAFTFLLHSHSLVFRFRYYKYKVKLKILRTG